MISREFVLICVFAAISIIGSTGYFWIQDEIAFTNWWMLFNALTYPVLLLIIRLLAKDKYLQIASSTLLILSLGEIYDELFADPVLWGWPEVINLLVAGGYVFIKLNQCRRKQN
jgi:hypothetical protein